MSVVSSTLISEGQALSPREIWDKAEAVSKTGTYTAEDNSGDVKVKIFQRANPDGTVFKRSDYESSLKNSTLLVNSSGEYHIYHPSKIMIKTPYNILSAPLDFSNDASYSIQSQTFNGIDCYVVTQKIEPTPEVVKKFFAAIPESILKFAPDMKQQMLENAFIASKRKYIGKKDFFIYCIEGFLLNGKLKSRYTYENVELNPSIKDDLFQIPKGYKLEIANTYDEFMEKDKVIVDKLIDASLEASRRSRQPASDGVFTLTLQWIERNFSTITTILSRILFWSAILIIAGVIIYKIKNK